MDDVTIILRRRNVPHTLLTAAEKPLQLSTPWFASSFILVYGKYAGYDGRFLYLITGYNGDHGNPPEWHPAVPSFQMIDEQREEFGCTQAQLRKQTRVTCKLMCFSDARKESDQKCFNLRNKKSGSRSERPCITSKWLACRLSRVRLSVWRPLFRNEIFAFFLPLPRKFLNSLLNR
jgi:hypothetical protein